MKQTRIFLILLCLMALAVPSHAFLDYLFGGSSSRGAVGNSTLGDFRAWWTGNPAYTFNPFYSPSPRMPGQQSPMGAYGVPQTATSRYYTNTAQGRPQYAPQSGYYPQQAMQGQYRTQYYQQYGRATQATPSQYGAQAYQGYSARPQAQVPQYQGAVQTYQGQPAYQNQPAYQGQTTYRMQPQHQGQAAYQGTPQSQTYPGAVAQPGYR